MFAINYRQREFKPLKSLHAVLSFHILKKQHGEKAEVDVNRKWTGSAGRIERPKQNLGHIFESKCLMISFYLLFAVLWTIG